MKKIIKVGFGALLIAMQVCLPMTQTSVSAQATKSTQTLLDEMTLDQKITQMLMPDFRQWKNEGEANKDMTVLSPEVAEIIDQYDFGGVILFANNVKETEQTLKLTNDLQAAAIGNQAGNGNIPLLITIDQEGGIVYRLGSGTALPGNMALGATGSSEYATQVGEVIGRELSALGLNVNFAPVFDVNNNPNNPVIGLRSISSDPSLVSRLGVSAMKGMQSYNVATSAKHFPGHGDTATDSHTGLPMVNKTYEELSQLELVPFQAAVDNGVDMLMTAHIQYPLIETDTAISKLNGDTINIPATLSDDIITGIVREKMNYDGIVITDAMNMDAIAKNFGESEAVIMAIQADVDICLMPTILRSKADLAKLDTLIADVKAAIADGRIPMATIDKSVSRILKLKEERGVLNYANDTTPWEQKLAKANAEVGSTLNRNIERTVANAAVTMVKNEDTILPFKPQATDKVLLLGAYDNELPGMQLTINRLKAEGKVPATTEFKLVRYSGTTTIDDLKASIDESNYVVVVSEIGSAAQLVATHWLTKIPTEVIDYANSKNIDAALMSISKPYDTANYPNAKAITAVYGNKGMDPTEALQPDAAFGPNIPAGIEVIFGGYEAGGKLPVNVPVIENGVMDVSRTHYALGHGMTYRDAVSGIAVQLPQSVKQEEVFKSKVTLGDLQGLSKQDYRVVMSVNTTDFTILETKTRNGVSYQVDGDKVTFDISANTAPDLNVSMKAKNIGTGLSPIHSIQVVDAKSRTFSMGDGAYASNILNILPKAGTGTESEGTQTKPDNKTPSTAPGTGDTTSMTDYAWLALATFTVLYVMTKKRQIEE